TKSSSRTKQWTYWLWKTSRQILPSTEPSHWPSLTRLSTSFLETKTLHWTFLTFSRPSQTSTATEISSTTFSNTLKRTIPTPRRLTQSESKCPSTASTLTTPASSLPLQASSRVSRTDQ